MAPPPSALPSSLYLNPFLHALFYNPEPGQAVRKLRTYLQDPSRFSRNVIVIPPLALMWAYDADSRTPFSDLIASNEDFLASHILIIPSDSKSTDRSRRMSTFNNKTVFVFKNFIQTNAGFKAHFNSKIMDEYIITPLSPYLPEDAQFVVYEIAYPLVGRPTFPTLISNTSSTDNSSNGTSSKLILPPMPATLSSSSSISQAQIQQQDLFDSKIIEPPEYFGVDLEKVKVDIKIRRDYKLLPIIYTNDIAKPDLELLHMINIFSIDEVNSTTDLVDLYNKTIESAMRIFSSVGSSILTRIMNETGLSSPEIGQMIGEYVEAQLHQQLWEKTMQLHQKKDAVTADLCWEMKDISIEQLDIPEKDMTILFDLDDLVGQAVKLFSSLTSITNVADKAKVLLSVVQILSNGTPDQASGKDNLQRPTKCSVHYNMEINNDPSYSSLKNAMNADTLVSLMIMVIVRSEMVNINSLLFYIRQFSFSEVEMGHLGYALSTLEAATYHIANHGKKIAKLSQLNRRFFDCLPSLCKTMDFIDYLEKSKPKYWKSVVRSRTSNGVTALTTALQEATKVGADIDECMNLLDYLFDLRDVDGEEVFNTNYVVGDRDGQGFSLFLQALDTEDEDVIFSVLSKIDALDDTEMGKYFARVNNMKRSVGHYIFHSHWLIPEIGHLIDWEQKDLAGQTPLFALCRCYDHQNYTELVDLGLKAWESQRVRKSPGEPVNLMYHQDPKDNTLLHIVKDKSAVDRLLTYDIDVNWPNESGFSPLMVYSKFSRLEAIQSLLRDPRVDKLQQSESATNALELAKDADTIRYLESQYIPREDHSMALTTLLSSSLQNPGNSFGGGGSETMTCVLRTSLAKGRLFFIITTGKRGDAASVISVRRSFDDFKFLAKWLGYESPYSWVPPLTIAGCGNGPKILHGKTVYQLFHDIQFRLNVFLRTLMAHPTFGAHELLWEFVLVQELSRDSVIERCRRKLQNAQESQMEKEAPALFPASRSSSVSSDSSVNIFEDKEREEAARERREEESAQAIKNLGLQKPAPAPEPPRSPSSGVFFYRSGDLEPIQYFMKYTQDQLTRLAQSTSDMHTGMQKMCVAVDSYNTAVSTMFDMLGRFPAAVESVNHTKPGSHTTKKPFLDATLQKSLRLGMQHPREVYTELSVSLHSLGQIVDSGAKTLEAPISMIGQLKEREATLGVLHRAVEKLAGSGGNNGSNGSSGSASNSSGGGLRNPFASIGGMGSLLFEDKRVREMNETNDKIYICQNEINRLSTDIHRYHETLASEVGALYTVHEAELRRYIQTFAGGIVHAHRTGLERLRRVQQHTAAWRDAEDRGGEKSRDQGEKKKTKQESK